MNKNIILIILVTIILSPVIKSQSLKVGFRVEPSILLIEHNNETDISFTPYSLYLTTLVVPTKWLNLEVRSGLFLAGEEYSGFEIGVFAMFKIFPKGIYIITGLNNHSNRGSGHNGGGSYAKQILYKGVGIGFQKNSKLSFDLMYYWTNDKDYAYSIVIDSSSGYTTMVNKKMNGILKVGFSLAWDIL